MNDFLKSVAQAEAIINAKGTALSPLERYLELRDLAEYPLLPQSAERFGAIKAMLRRIALAPIDGYNERLLSHMRHSLLSDYERDRAGQGGRPRLLYLAPFDVLSRNGGAVRILGLAKALAEDFEVVIISVVGSRRALEIIPVSPGVRICAVPQAVEFVQAIDNSSATYGGAAFSLGFEEHLDKMPMLRYFFEQHMQDAAVCIMNQPYWVRLWREWAGEKPYLVYDAPEVNSFFTLRNAGDAADRDAVSTLQRRLETETFHLADRIGMCSKVDIDDVLKEQGEAFRDRIVLVPNGVWVDEVLFMVPSEARKLRVACGWLAPVVVFMGAAGTQPNRDAVHYIARVLAPQHAGVTFALIGMNAQQTGLDVIPANVVPCGRVSDMAKTAILSMADFAISPIAEYDIGSSLKIAEYIAHGKPVLATPYGLRGYEMMQETIRPRPLEDLAIVLQEHLDVLARDPTALDAPAEVARDQLRKFYDWSVIGGRYELGWEKAKGFS
jgi:glycosyltransferase involved in cell wall biosynthesis